MSRLGFQRKLRLQWVNDAARAVQFEEPEATIQRIVATDIRGPEARYKTLQIVARMWCGVPPSDVELRDRAIDLFNSATDSERVSIHWGLAICAFPLFMHGAATFGRLSRLQATVSIAQLRQRMYEEWGERPLLDPLLVRLLGTWCDWGVVARVGKGIYAPLYLPPPSANVAFWLAGAWRSAHDLNGAASLAARGAPDLFPFDLSEVG